MTEPSAESLQQPSSAPSDGPSGPRASFGRRFLAFLIDILVLAVPNGILIALLDDNLANALAALVNAVYFVYGEGRPAGQTIGKIALGIRVIDFRTGGPIGYGRAIGRYFARILSTLPILLGYFWMLWDREKQTWHDKLVTSVVVPTDAYPVQR